LRLARLAPAKAQRVADLSFREATKAIAEKKPLARAAPWRMAEPHDIARFDFERPLHPLCKIFPMMPDDELADLADSIKEGGLLLPITLYKDGSLLDGKLRYIACRMAGVEPRFETLPDDDDPVAAVISRNVMRTGLTPSVQAVWTAAAHLLYPGSRVLPLRMLEMAFDVLQNSPACFEPLRSGALHLTEAHNRMLAERDATAERDHMLTALRVEAPDLAELVTAGQVTLADAVAAADERRERAHRAQLFDASADLLKSLADE
jgi:hypothetical protein